MTLNKKIVDLETGEETIVEYSKTEMEIIKAREAEIAIQAAEDAAKEAAKQAVLDKLGLSAEEVSALLG